MENIQRDLGELIQKFQVLFNNEDIEQWEWEWDRKKHNDWQILKFAHHLQVHIQRQRDVDEDVDVDEGDEFSHLIVPTRGEVIVALHALFEDTEEEDNEEEDTDAVKCA